MWIFFFAAFSKLCHVSINANIIQEVLLLNTIVYILFNDDAWGKYNIVYTISVVWFPLF